MCSENPRGPRSGTHIQQHSVCKRRSNNTSICGSANMRSPPSVRPNWLLVSARGRCRQGDRRHRGPPNRAQNSWGGRRSGCALGCKPRGSLEDAAIGELPEQVEPGVSAQGRREVQRMGREKVDPTWAPRAWIWAKLGAVRRLGTLRHPPPRENQRRWHPWSSKCQP